MLISEVYCISRASEFEVPALFDNNVKLPGLLPPVTSITSCPVCVALNVCNVVQFSIVFDDICCADNSVPHPERPNNKARTKNSVPQTSKLFFDKNGLLLSVLLCVQSLIPTRDFPCGDSDMTFIASYSAYVKSLIQHSGSIQCTASSSYPTLIKKCLHLTQTPRVQDMPSLTPTPPRHSNPESDKL